MQYTKNRMSKLLIRLCSEVPTRFELVIRELQSLALPLGYVTKNKLASQIKFTTRNLSKKGFKVKNAAAFLNF